MRLEDVRQALAADDAEIRRHAAGKLAPTLGEGWVPLLIAALSDADWRVRKEATAAAIEHHGTVEAIRALIGVFESSDNIGLRNAAVEVLGGYGEMAIPELDRTFASLDADARKLVVDALAKTGHASALTPLTRAIDDEDPNVAAAALEGVAVIGTTCADRAILVLDGCLDATDRMQRLAALDGLNQLAAELSWSRLEPLMVDPVLEPAVLVAAGRTADPEAARVLVRVLANSQGVRQRHTIAALVQLLRAGSRCREAVTEALAQLPPRVVDELLVLAAGRIDLDLARSALLLVGALGTRAAAECVVDSLADDRVAASAEEALEFLGESTQGVLVDRAGSSDPLERASCIELLGRLGLSATPEVRNVIRSGLEDSDDDVVVASLGALAAVGGADSLREVARSVRTDAPPPIRLAAESALSTLSLRHPDSARTLVRGVGADGSDAVAAAVVIGASEEPMFGTRAEDMAFLVSLLSSDLPHARRIAIDGIGAIGDPSGVESVAFALTDEEREVRLAAVRALANMGASAAERLVEVAETSRDHELSVAAIRALGQGGEGVALDVLRRLAREPSEMVAVAAVDALARLQDPERIDALIDAVAHGSPEVVKAALSGLARERDPRALAHLCASLDHDAWDVRRLSADLLGRVGGPTSMSLLRSKLASEQEPLVRAALSRALESLEASGGLRKTLPPPGSRAR